MSDVEQLKEYTEAVGTVCKQAETGDIDEEPLVMALELAQVWLEVKSENNSLESLRSDSTAQALMEIVKVSQEYLHGDESKAEAVGEAFKPMHETMVIRVATLEHSNTELSKADDPTYY